VQRGVGLSAKILKEVVMRKTNLSKSVVVVCVIVVSAGLVFAEDWPQWRGANRDGKVSGFKAPAKWPKELTKKWKVTVGSGDATPALVGEKLYVFTRQGAEEVTLCLNAGDGKKIWEDKY
jgi:outer membrane protein assembly factor BamB